MKTKKLTPRNSAPVQRENAATVSRDGNAIAPFNGMYVPGMGKLPFAGDDAEQSNAPDPSTNFKSYQKSFSACQGARFAPTN